MKKLSERMKENLLNLFKFDGNPKVRLGGRCVHHANQVTHDALLRRGLIQEANDDFHTTTLTDKGRKIARGLVG